MKIPVLLTASMLALAVCGAASAEPWAPHGTLVFTEPTGVVGPNATVNAQMRFTLDTNSQPIDLTAQYPGDLPAGWLEVTGYSVNVAFGCSDTFSGGCKFTNGNPYNFSFDGSSDGYSRIQNDSLVMNPGQSITFNAFTFTPNVAAVPPGTYFAYYYEINGTVYGTMNGSDVMTSINIAQNCSSFDGEGCSGPQVFSRTVGAVPEPETYAMLLGGLGLLGFFTRHRKQNAA